MEKPIYDVLSKLEDNDFLAYIVGGYVRDYLRNKRTSDIDICTNATPKDVIKIFKEYNPMPRDYGNVILEKEGFLFEITTFRKDINYKDNRKPVKIKYIKSLEIDLLRRDFTINSVCMDKDGKIIDLLEGKKDLNKKLIRTIGYAGTRINEDSLRIMRAIRFATVLNFRIDNELIKAIKDNKELLKNLSYDRKKEELSKIFLSENKKYGIRLLKELDLVNVLELQNIDSVLLSKDLIGMWSTITTNDNYPFTKTEKELIKNINLLLKEDLNDQMVLYKYGIYTISIVCDLKKYNKKKYLDKYNKLPIKDRNEILITTEEICDLLNIEPGPFLKDLYNKIELVILNNKIKNTNEEIKKYIKEQMTMI